MAAIGLALGISIVLLVVAIFALVILSFVFWILMIVDCAKRKFKNENDRVVWILVIVLAQLIGAIIYYFVVKKK